MAYTILDATAECHLIDDQESAIRTDIVNSTLPDTDHDVQFELVGSLAELNYLIEKGEDSAVTATEIHVFVWQYVGGEKRELRPPTSEHRDAVNLRNELIF
jgi:hypothetical protein